MNDAIPFVSVIAFAGWTMMLLFLIVSWRVILVVTGKRRSNAFPSGQPHGSGTIRILRNLTKLDFYWRINRSHQNAVENLPIFASIAIGGNRIKI